MEQRSQFVSRITPTDDLQRPIERVLLFIRGILPIIALTMIGFCIWCFAVSVSDLRTYSGWDLRLKVVGARKLYEGINPYKLESIDSQPDRFKSAGPAYSTPAVLALYLPLEKFSWRVQRVVYFSLDWLFALAAFYLFQRYFCRTRAEKLSCWFIYASFVLCSCSFRLHLERGQYYVLVLLLSCHAAAAVMKNWTSWISCFPTAFLLLLRPTYVLFLVVALACLGSSRWVIRVAFVTLLMFLALLPVCGIRSWEEFGPAVAERQEFHLARITALCANEEPVSQDSTIGVIEGVDFSKRLDVHSVTGTLIGLFNHSPAFVKNHRTFTCEMFPAHVLKLLNAGFEILTLAAGLIIMFIARGRNVDRKLLVAFMVLWPMVLEIFAPDRGFYLAVIEVLPLLLVLMYIGTSGPNFGLTNKFSWLVGFSALGVLPSVAFQVYRNPDRFEEAMSVMILVVLPVCLALFCTYAVLASPKASSLRA